MSNIPEPGPVGPCAVILGDPSDPQTEFACATSFGSDTRPKLEGYSNREQAEAKAQAIQKPAGVFKFENGSWINVDHL